MLDFAYPRAVMQDLAAAAASLLVLDHHKTAAADIGDLPYCRFDMTRSGCAMAWSHYHADAPLPPLLAYIQDKDLWTWKLDASNEVSAALASHPMDFRLWDQLTIDALKRDGSAIRRYQSQLVRDICAQARRGRFAGEDVPFVNTPVLQSYVGNALARGEKFVVLWHERPDGTLRVSLRSTDGGKDVAEIARAYGGGGHERAAGFGLPGMEALRR
jgi:oligoribonuclease NrnB/cAMP/cGMP phosphodiesterase (DHH superfamily)